WGKAGSGKTLLASIIACNESRYSKVEWINTDAKQSFVPQLKRIVESEEGVMDNITVTMANDRHEIREVILNLSEFLDPEVSLVVIDSITRILDMAREDPILWGREMIEESLPTLAGLVSNLRVNIIIISETRAMEDSNILAVHQKTISKWVDHDILLTKTNVDSSSKIMRGLKNRHQIGILKNYDVWFSDFIIRNEAEV
ncbi:MAG: hypothetical protein ACFFE3_12130, partial [Candidatus Thorarchaeota archaeon]